MNEEQDKVPFILETSCIGEVKSTSITDWADDGAIEIGENELSEILGGDETPFYIDFVGLYEGLSGNNRQYTKEAVESCVESMVGVNMYKGHQEPGTESWKYREPVGRIVASRLSHIEVDGKRVLAAKGKAYITEADTKLRSDIGRKMAGPLSILGNARAVREFGSSKRTITHIHKPLTSVDFCNPGTNGMPGAGVTAIVREMSGKEPDPKQDGPERKQVMDTKLTKEQLLADYGDIIRSIIGEQMTASVEEFASQKRQFAEEKEAFKDVKTKYDEQIAEAKNQNKELKEKLDTSEKAKGESEAKLMLADLNNYVLGLVKEMKENDDNDEQIVELAADGLDVTLVECDLDKSKEAYKARLQKSITGILKVKEIVGGTSHEEDEPKKRSHTKNKSPSKKTIGLDSILSPELIEAGKEKK